LQRRRAPDADGDGEEEALLQLAEMGGGEDSDAAGRWVQVLASLLDPPSQGDGRWWATRDRCSGSGGVTAWWGTGGAGVGWGADRCA